MVARHYYLVAALPAMGELGSPPPWTTGDLMEHVRDTGAAELVAALLVGQDLLQREALREGEIGETRTAVLTGEQVAGSSPLPSYLGLEEADETVRHAGDAVWSAWFRYAAEAAQRRGSRLLQLWVGHEVALRNALVKARAEALGLEPEDYLVAVDLADADEDLAGVLAEWAAAADPLAGQRVLDRARWGWLEEHEAWFGFGVDELLVYAARLTLLDRWHRVGEAAGRDGG